MASSSPQEVCARITQLRIELAGPRGKANFAKQLGLSPSTYDYYESSRVPPAEVLVKISDLAGVDLRWLITGEAAKLAVPAGHPVLRRAAEMLSHLPNAAAPLAAFIDVLAESLKFPAKPASPHGEGASDAHAAWIPVLGRSAAGIPQFWSSDSEAAGVTALADLLERHLRRPARQSEPAQIAADDAGQGPGQLITLTAPDEGDVAEYVAAARIKSAHGDAFAVRIDGDSMEPEIRHGDLVILSPSAPAIDGRSAVVQLKRQIGLTCKIYRHQGSHVHLVPLAAKYPPQAFAQDQVVWALRVLARVRGG